MGDSGESASVEDTAFDMAHDDVLTAWRVRNAALAVAAAFVHPGPDHADMTARQALVREWVSEGHDQVEAENHQRTQMLNRMIRAERESERLRAAMLDVFNAFDVFVEEYDDLEPLSAAMGQAIEAYNRASSTDRSTSPDG